MDFKLDKCIVTRKYTNADKGVTYLTVLGLDDGETKGGGDLNISGEASVLAAVPENKIISLAGRLVGRVYGYGKESQQRLQLVGRVAVKEIA